MHRPFISRWRKGKRLFHPRYVNVWLRLVLLCVICGGRIVPGSAALTAVAFAAPVSPTIEVTFHHGLLTVKAQNATLTEVLRAVGDVVGIKTFIYGEIDASTTTWSLVDVPLFEAIRFLVGDHNMAMVYHGSSGQGVTKEASKLWVYGKPSARSYTPPALPIDSPPRDVAKRAQTVPATRLQAMQNSAESEDESETASLARTLIQDTDTSVRSQAAAVLADIAGEEAIKALEAGLGDPNPAVRIKVIGSLEALQAEQAIPTLGQVLFSDPSPQVRLAAVAAIARQQSEAVPAFLEAAAKDKDRAVRTAALSALARWK